MKHLERWFPVGAVLFAAGTIEVFGHPSHPLEPVDYPIVAGFENFYIQDDSDNYLADGGELLLSELNCVACHKPKSEIVRERIPGKSGPILSGVGSRMAPGDIRMMVRNPRQVKRGTTMPSLFAGPDRDLEAIEALTHFLVSRKAKIEAVPLGDAERGQKIYHETGCVACHSMEFEYRPGHFPENREPELPGFPSIPLALTYLYNETALARFLHRPLELRPSGRMPDMKLSLQEAADIARYLQASLPEPAVLEEFSLDTELAERGKKLFAQRNCVACHDGEEGFDAKAPPAAKALEDLDPAAKRSCLAESPQVGGIPFYYLDFIQKQAIELAVKRLKEPAGARELAAREKVDRTMTRMNCYACHSREGKGGAELARAAFFWVTDPAAISMGDFGNTPPPLDHVGRKLTREWMEKILWGSGGEVRPFMTVRMPGFGQDNLRHLGAAFAEADVRDPPMEMDISGLQRHQRGHYGRDLLGINGLGCVTCHGLKDAKALGAPAINLTHTVERLQPGYFKELLLDPQNIQPGTLMPPLFMGREKADQEVEQIWTYLKEIDQGRLPDGLLKTEDFELKPDKEPIVFRTFLEGAGMQAVAIGFPQGVHAAFDSLEVRWAVAWRGRFLDAMTTWDQRAATPAKPLGDKVMELPLHLPLARLDRPGAPWPEETGTAAGYRFEGYRLDKNGVPAFLYSFESLGIEDKLIPAAEGRSLKRVLKITGEGSGDDLYFRGLTTKAQPVLLEDGKAVIEEVLEW